MLKSSSISLSKPKFSAYKSVPVSAMSHLILCYLPVDKTDPSTSAHVPRRNSGRSSHHMAQPGPPDSGGALGIAVEILNDS